MSSYLEIAERALRTFRGKPAKPVGYPVVPASCPVCDKHSFRGEGGFWVCERCYPEPSEEPEIHPDEIWVQRAGAVDTLNSGGARQFICDGRVAVATPDTENANVLAEAARTLYGPDVPVFLLTDPRVPERLRQCSGAISAKSAKSRPNRRLNEGQK